MSGQQDVPDDSPEDDVEQDPELAENDPDAAADPLAELQAKADENWDRYLRAAAEAHGRVIDRIKLRDRAGAERAMRAVIGRAKVELRRRRTRIAVAPRDAS